MFATVSQRSTLHRHVPAVACAQETRYGLRMGKRASGTQRVRAVPRQKPRPATRRSAQTPDPRALIPAALDHVADMVLICDAAGRHVFLNPAARALALTDAIGAPVDSRAWGDWFDADGQPFTEEQWPVPRVLRGEARVENEMGRYGEDGTITWILLSAASIRDADGQIVGAVATASDITARKQAQAEAHALKEELAHRVGARTAAFEALQNELAREVRQRLDASELLERSRRMLQSILDRTGAVIYVKDTAYRYLLVNAQFERIFSVTNDAVAGRTDYDLFAPEIVKPLRTNDEHVLTTGEGVTFEEVAPHPDGLHTYVSVKFPLRGDDGVIYALCGVSTDITDRKRVEAELHRSQATLATVIDSGGDAILLIDSEYRLVVCNAVVDRIFVGMVGAPPVTGIDFRPQIPDTLEERWRGFLARGLAGEEMVVDESVTIFGELRHFLVSLNPIIERQQVTGVAIFAKDITELRHAEQLALRHQGELAHVLRQHTMGLMAASLAHEINQPLGAIANYSQGSRRRLEAGTMTAAEIQSTMSEIAREALRAGAITRRVRELIQKDEPSRTIADINEIVRAVLEIVGPTTRERGINIRFHRGIILPAIAVDRIQIEQVVLNLLLNALDAVAGVAAPTIEVRTTVDAEGVEVSVSDNGAGVDAVMCDKIFEPFFTTKEGGLGMGLAISRSIVDAHDGRIWASANPQGGTTFHCVLPSVRAGA